MLEIINLERLLADKDAFRDAYHAKKPFKYLVFDDLLHAEKAREIYREFPRIKADWIDANGLHQKNKWTQPMVCGSVAERFFEEANSDEFRRYLTDLTGIDHLLPDHDFFGAGYHQTTDGGFLNVHVDFNRSQDASLDRRLNMLLYLNSDWQDSYGGNLELWDMNVKVCLESIQPVFNRCVLFETNKFSYHGHPVPLATNGKTTRKSLSVYYYTDGRDDDLDITEHNTLYLNTQGASGMLKLSTNAVRETMRRIINTVRR